MDAPLRFRAPDPPRVRAYAGVIDVWRADLTGVEDGGEDLLRADELARAARIVSGRKRVLWVRSRSVLRALLGRYLERDPRELSFALGPHGKPALAREGIDVEEEDLRFNLSHSGALALVAVTAGREVGIDLEVAGRQVLDEPALAARVFGRAQAARLAELDPRTRERGFMRMWVAHEATVKCRGLGLFTPPRGSPRPADSLAELATKNSPPELATPRDSPLRPATPGDLWTAELDAGPDVYAAVTVQGGPCELHIRDWCA